MEIIQKIVDFEYCKTCEHKNTHDFLDPCHECLNNPTNTYSKRPVNYKQEETKKEKENE